MGKWFEIKRYEVYFQRGSECSQALYTKIGETIFVENSSIKNGNPRSTTNGTAILADPTADPLQGQLIVAFRNRTPGTTANYNILDTDYDNYSIVFNCQSLGNGKSAGTARWVLILYNLITDSVHFLSHAEVAWILSRTATVNPDVEEKINVIVEKYLQKDKLRATVQDAVT